MRKQDYEDIVNDMLNFKASIERGHITRDVLDNVEDRLVFLNACIDAMEINKSAEDYDLIGIAYRFYRMRSELDI